MHRQVTEENVRRIREFRNRVTQLKIYRAKGYCEICHAYFGKRSYKIKGHHVIQPMKYFVDTDPDTEENIIICCDPCYKKDILTRNINIKAGGLKGEKGNQENSGNHEDDRGRH